MFKPMSAIFKISIFVFAFGLLVNCSSKSNSSKSSLKAGGGAGNIEGSVKSSGASAAVLAEAVCENTIPLENSEALLIEKSDQLPKGKWNLVSMDFHMLDEEDNGTYYITADSKEEFQPKVACNGISDLKDANFEKTTTDSNGGTLTKTSKSTSSRSGAFSAAEWINNLTEENSDLNRKIEVRFEKNELVSAKTSTSNNEHIKSKTSADEKMERLEVEKDTFITARKYLLSKNQFELRVKLEYPAEDGKRNIQHARATFELAK